MRGNNLVDGATESTEASADLAARAGETNVDETPVHEATGDDVPVDEANAHEGWASAIVIHVRAGRPAAAALITAVGLARSLEVDVRSLYIEDQSLLSLAALPCAREISFSGGRSSSLSTARLQDDMRQASTALRRDLAKLAGQAGVQVDCDVVRDDPLTALDRQCAAGAIIALIEPFDREQSAALRRIFASNHAVGALVCGPYATETDGPIVVLLTSTAGLNTLMESAGTLQRPDDRELSILTLGHDSDKTASITAAARIATGYDRSVSIQAVEARRGPAMIADTTRRMGAGLIVARWQETEDLDLDGLVTALDCPLLLLR
jgi:hypothetical protein